MQASIKGVSVKGLKGCKTLNKDPDPKNPIEDREERSVYYAQIHYWMLTSVQIFEL